MTKTYEEINAKIKKGEAVVVTAEEMIGIVEEHGVEYAAKEIDVVTTGTFGIMCSSGAFFNFGHADPPIKMEHLWLNDVHLYHGGAAVDAYLGVTRMASPRNYDYGGGHVLEDLLKGKKVRLKATAYGTDCYPRTALDTEIALEDMNQALLFNPRNAYQHYVCAVNASDKTIYTYMGKLLPNLGNATYSGAGELSPLNNDPDYETIGVGTHIFLCGGDGIITGEGTQHCPKSKFGTIMVQGDMKTMSPEYLAGASVKGYGTSCYIGIGVPIPILNERIAKNCAVKDEDIITEIVDYSTGRLNRPELGKVTYAELKSGLVKVKDQEIKVSSMSSLYKARKIAEELKQRIKDGKFLLYKPVRTLSTTTEFHQMDEASPVELVKHKMRPAIVVKVDNDFKEVAELVLKHNDNHVVVVDDNQQLEGFFTTFDFTQFFIGKGSTIKEIMIPKRKVHTVRETDPVDMAIRQMKKYNISSIPVLDADEKVVGIISAEDLIHTEDGHPDQEKENCEVKGGC